MKRIGYILSIVVACTVLLCGALLCLVGSSKVQTALVQVLTQELSKGLQTEVQIGKVDYRLFNNLEVNGIYIEDHQQDTLLYVDTLQARFQFAGFFRKEIIFSGVDIQHVTSKIYPLQNGEMNTAFLADVFQRDREDIVLPHIEVKNVRIADGRLRLMDNYLNALQADLSLHCLSADSLNAEVASLRFAEERGFSLDEFSAQVIANYTGVWMPRLYVNLPASHIEAQTLQVTFPELAATDTVPSLQERIASLADSATLARTKVSLEITHATLSPADIGAFVPALKNMTGLLDFSGKIKGSMHELHATGLALDYGKHEILRGNISVYGFPHRNAQIQANLQDLRLDKALVQDVVSDIQNRPYQLPTSVAQLGVVHYRGKLTGRRDSLNLHGAFTTKLGAITTEGKLLMPITADDDSIRQAPSPLLLAFNGQVQTKRFDLGKLIGQQDLGTMALNTEINLRIDTANHISADLCAKLPFITYRDYTYRNAHIDGEYKTGMFEGKMEMNDPNVGVYFDGIVDMTQRLPLFDFDLQVERFRMGELHLSEKYADSDLRFGLALHVTGDSPDNVNGVVQIDTLTFRNKEKTLFMNECKILAETGGEETAFKVQSDYLNANIAGQYTYRTLLQTAQGIVMQYMPRVFSTQQRDVVEQTKRQNAIHYYAYLQNTDLISEVLELPVSLGGTPTIKGLVQEADNQFLFQMLLPEVTWKKMHLRDVTLDMDNYDEQLNLSLYLMKLAGQTPAGERMGDLTCLLQSEARHDSLFLDFDFTNNDSIRNAGTIALQTHFAQYAQKPLVSLEFLPTQVVLNDSTWKIGNSRITYTAADTTLQVDQFSFASSDRHIWADGLASTRMTDSIKVDLKDIIVDYILDYTEVADAQISFGGAATGWGVVYSLFRQPMFEADLRMDDAKINNALMGDATASARWNREQKTVDITGQVVEQGDTVGRVTGIVTPAIRRWDLFIEADSANLGFIEYWTQGIFSEIAGRGYGDIHVFGQNKKTWVEGRAMAKNGTLGLGMLGTKYTFTDSVFIDINKIRFEQIQMQDEEGNNLLVDGYLAHDSLFGDFQYDININCEKTLVMNLPETAQDMFYGKVYATGTARVRGDEAECRIRANATTDAKTDFYLSLATASSARDNSFITFKNPQADWEIQKEDKKKRKTTDTKVFLDLQIGATPAADVTLIIDPKTGDRLEGRGEGNLKLSYDLAADDIKLYGNYGLNTGTFYFTFQNVIRKEFALREGSRVYFTGDPMNLQVDASATYTTTASLKDLFGTDFEQVSTNRSSVPVNCILYLKDQMMNPTITFGIELPQSDESVASQVRSVISTEDMMMRQILYLLVFNRFYTPEYLQASTGSVGLNETYSLISSTVTGQINNWLSKMTDQFTIGFNMRADGLDANSSQEYETQFQYQPNNRLLINGNFGYRYNDISNQPLFGNLDVEYLLTPSGMWRVKAYTHTVDKYSLKEAHTVQGVGLMFKYDFSIPQAKPDTITP